jgi:hypothetical protein
VYLVDSTLALPNTWQELAANFLVKEFIAHVYNKLIWQEFVNKYVLAA